MIEVTLAPSGSRTLIGVDLIGEVRDLANLPSRHLGKFGRTLIRHHTKSLKWTVFEEYEVVRQRLAEDTDAWGATDQRASAEPVLWNAALCVSVAEWKDRHHPSAVG